MKLLTEEEIAETRKLHEVAQWLQPVVSVGAPGETRVIGNIPGMAEARTIVERVPALLFEVERSRALLKRIEWTVMESSRFCPVCEADEANNEGHKSDCELAALIEKTP